MKLVQTSASSSFGCNSDVVQVAIKTKTPEKNWPLIEICGSVFR